MARPLKTFSLDDEAVYAISHRQLSIEQLQYLHDEARYLYYKGLKSWRRAMIVAGIIIAIEGILTMIHFYPSIYFMVYMAAALTGIFFVVVILTRREATIARRQFVRNLKKGYPELADIMGDSSF